MYTNTSYSLTLKQSQIIPDYLIFRFINVIIDQNTISVAVVKLKGEEMMGLKM